MIKITQEMVNKLNYHLEAGGYAVRFELYELWPNGCYVGIKTVLPNDKGLMSYIINIEDDLFEQVKCWFLINHKLVIEHNNTRNIFWAVRELKEENNVPFTD